jgi:hypothetical protein
MQLLSGKKRTGKGVIKNELVLLLFKRGERMREIKFKEGDIVIHNEAPKNLYGKIVIYKEELVVEFPIGRFGLISELTHECPLCKIGNIYENPELLEDKK